MSQRPVSLSSMKTLDLNGSAMSELADTAPKPMTDNQDQNVAEANEQTLATPPTHYNEAQKAQRKRRFLEAWTNNAVGDVSSTNEPTMEESIFHRNILTGAWVAGKVSNVAIPRGCRVVEVKMYNPHFLGSAPEDTAWIVLTKQSVPGYDEVLDLLEPIWHRQGNCLTERSAKEVKDRAPATKTVGEFGPEETKVGLFLDMLAKQKLSFSVRKP